MSNDSRKERERLKEEYKEHYRKMRETKERLSRAQKTKNIADALKRMDTSELMDSFDDFLLNVKQKIAMVEARLDVAMDDLLSDTNDIEREQENALNEELRKEKARETLRQAKMEMGLLYNEIEKQADAIRVDKTIGNKPAGEKENSHPPAEEPGQELERN